MVIQLWLIYSDISPLDILGLRDPPAPGIIVPEIMVIQLWLIYSDISPLDILGLRDPPAPGNIVPEIMVIQLWLIYSDISPLDILGLRDPPAPGNIVPEYQSNIIYDIISLRTGLANSVDQTSVKHLFSLYYVYDFSYFSIWF